MLNEENIPLSSGNYFITSVKKKFRFVSNDNKNKEVLDVHFYDSFLGSLGNSSVYKTKQNIITYTKTSQFHLVIKINYKNKVHKRTQKRKKNFEKKYYIFYVFMFMFFYLREDFVGDNN